MVARQRLLMNASWFGWGSGHLLASGGSGGVRVGFGSASGFPGGAGGVLVGARWVPSQILSSVQIRVGSGRRLASGDSGALRAGAAKSTVAPPGQQYSPGHSKVGLTQKESELIRKRALEPSN